MATTMRAGAWACVLALAGAVAACGGGGGGGGGSGSGGGGGGGGGSGGQRVVSLTPSATEIIAALGATETLVAVDDYSTYPPEVTALPKVGSFLAPNLEVIARLRPTLVVADDIHQDAAAALGDLGIASVIVPVHALPDVERALQTLGDRLGRRAIADEHVAAMRRAIDEARRRAPGNRPRVLAIIDREIGGLGGLVAAGTGSWVDELLAIVGADNAMTGAGVRYPKLSLEEVLKAQPEVILDASYAADAARPLEAWRAVDVPAVKTGRVRAVKEPFVLAPSPRVAEALAVIAAAMAVPPS